MKPSKPSYLQENGHVVTNSLWPPMRESNGAIITGQKSPLHIVVMIEGGQSFPHSHNIKIVKMPLWCIRQAQSVIRLQMARMSGKGVHMSNDLQRFAQKTLTENGINIPPKPQRVSRCTFSIQRMPWYPFVMVEFCPRLWHAYSGRAFQQCDPNIEASVSATEHTIIHEMHCKKDGLV